MSSFEVFEEVFSRKKYIFLVVLVSLIFYSLNLLFSSWTIFNQFSSNKTFLGFLGFFFFSFFKGGLVMSLLTLISLVIVSFLIGVLVSLIVYKLGRNMRMNEGAGFFGTIGAFFAALVPGCLTCGVGLAPLLGIGAGALSFLPFKGLGLSILSILILLFAIFKTVKDFNSCKISNSFRGNEKRIERR